MTLADLISYHKGQLIDCNRAAERNREAYRDRRASPHTREEYRKLAEHNAAAAQFHNKAVLLLESMK